MYVFFWVFPRRLIVVCRRFGTLYLFHLQGLDMKHEDSKHGESLKSRSHFANIEQIIFRINHEKIKMWLQNPYGVSYGRYIRAITLPLLLSGPLK